jgi:hypothetical protein
LKFDWAKQRMFLLTNNLINPLIDLMHHTVKRSELPRDPMVKPQIYHPIVSASSLHQRLIFPEPWLGIGTSYFTPYFTTGIALYSEFTGPLVGGMKEDIMEIPGQQG